jgi:acetyltransferase-like isoleucine patch superfamily enzyme
MGGTVYFLDPYLIEAGKNVQFGFGCLIAAHLFDRRGLLVRKVKISDHVVIGVQSVILPGVEIGHHSIIAIHSVLFPGTVVGPYEYWAGNPAKKIKNLGNNA